MSRMQDDIFLEGEGDNFYVRRLKKKQSNQQRLSEDLPLLLLKKSKYTPNYVAEIGACDGFRLGYIADKYGAKCYAYDPSKMAISDGKRLYPKVEFHHELASKLSCEDESYDLVIVNLVLHWVDRKMLLRTVAEIDRILKDEGLLIIGDTWPSFPLRKRYHHLPEKDVWTYKQAYMDIFLSCRLYYLLDFITKPWEPDDPFDRKSCALLRKSLNRGYASLE